jgi:hypothetical protein
MRDDYGANVSFNRDKCYTRHGRYLVFQYCVILPVKIIITNYGSVMSSRELVIKNLKWRRATFEERQRERTCARIFPGRKSIILSPSQILENSVKLRSVSPIRHRFVSRIGFT